jgi:ATPase domain predominantly from Archaea
MPMVESRQEFHRIPNLYSTGTPMYDKRMFYGREAEMAFLQDHLMRDTQTVIVLYGQGRAGKTTLLLQVINAFDHTRHIPVLIDMQQMSYHMTTSSFLYKVALFITQTMQKKHIAILQPDAADFKLEPTAAFGAFLDTVEGLLAGQKLILMVDEYEVLEEQFVKGKLNVEIFICLRNILQHRMHINFLFSGIHKITEFTKWYGTVFFNGTRHYRLSRLDPRAAEDLIQKPVGGFLEYELVTVKKIRRLTADQPYLIHLLCRTIVDYCNDKHKTYVKTNDVNVVLCEVMETIHFHFDWLWRQISPQERVVLSVLAEGSKGKGRWLTLDEITAICQHNHILFKREHLLDSLRSLIDADIVEVKPRDSTTLGSSRFHIPAGLMQRWLQKERPAEMAREELGD